MVTFGQGVNFLQTRLAYENALPPQNAAGGNAPQGGNANNVGNNGAGG